MFLDKVKILRFIFIAGFSLFAFAQVANAQFEISSFSVDNTFDVLGRSKIEAVSVKTTPNLYFYIEKSWWNAQSDLKKDEILKNLDDLSIEFQNNIYPNLTNIFGAERNPGIDNDNRITVLFHPVKGNEIGYFRTDDGYEKLQIPTSNAREMVYLSTDMLTNPKLKVALAHEFVHLITFNQKDISFRVDEDTWLNEARADYSSTILGYDDQPDLSNLQSRIRDFIESSSDSITEWRGTKYDYASVSLFIHYLVDHYGVKILSDSLKSRYVGIESINYALEKYGYKEKFSEVFTNWTIALILNDCSFGQEYCYLNKNLSGVKIVPNINFLPVSGSASLSVINTVKNWAGNWQRFIGGNGDLKLEFSFYGDSKFVVPYVTESKDGKYSVKYLVFGADKKDVINIPNFGTDYKSLSIIPSLQEKLSDFIGPDIAQPFNYSVNVGPNVDNPNQTLIQQLLEQIASLKKQIADLIAQQQGGSVVPPVSCSQISSNLSFGMTSNSQVTCLQQFLKNQGTDIYPEGLVTGFFGNLTKEAVKRFQEKYASEILTPLGLWGGTGYVGSSTRAKINQMISGA